MSVERVDYSSDEEHQSALEDELNLEHQIQDYWKARQVASREEREIKDTQ